MRGRSDLAELAARLRSLAAQSPGSRTVLGLAGPPGSGKSTLAGYLAAATGAVVVPMDGFHRPSAELARRGLLAVKGVPESFDPDAYVALLRQLRTDAEPVLAPDFDRITDEPVPDAIIVPPGATVITEGNYLLLDRPPWAEVPELLDESWYLDVPEPVRLARLIARHVDFGRSPEQAQARASTGSDADNARLVAATRDRADLVIELP